MIKNLHISNYALLKKVDISFVDGFTIVSGDTGAGKSIILDAISLLLGKSPSFLCCFNLKPFLQLFNRYYLI